jgi:hypothetical protein
LNNAADNPTSLALRPLFAAALAAVTLVAQGWRFEPIQPDIFGAGANFTNAFADVDGDGDLDLFVGFDGAPNRLYRNDRGTMVDTAAAAGVADARATRAAAFGDVDADGDPDLLLGFAPAKDGASVLKLYRNDKGRFSDITAAAGLSMGAGAVRQPAFVDIDRDDDLDLFVAFRDKANTLFRNDGGRFTDVAAAIGLADPRRTVGAVWFDMDEDGDLDVAVANMDGDANGLFRNDGGTFTDVAEAAGVAWGGREPGNKANGTVRTCAADVDGDGRLDLFFANYGPNGLFLNQGAGRFVDRSKEWGIAIDARYDACAFADFDNDGRVDLYVNGTVTGGTSYPDYLFRNTGAAFDNVTPENVRSYHADHGAQWADVDRDGDVDLALTGAQANGMHHLLRNMLPAAGAARSLHVRVTNGRGRATLAGAEVRVFEAGTTKLVGMALVDGGSGYDAQNDMPVHVGVGGAARVDVQVIAPSTGARTAHWTRGVRIAGLEGRPVDVRVGRR